MRLAPERATVCLLLLAPLVAQLAQAETSMTGRTPSQARECTEELLGAWTGMLDVERLFTLRLTITETTPGAFQTTLRFADGEERATIWRHGDRLRFQSRTRPIAFDFRVSALDTPMDGFIQYASHLVHVRIPYDGDSSWSTDWSYLGVRADRVRFDLYIEEVDERVAGGYLFFRDQRLPALHGEGLTCFEGDSVRLAERNLGLQLHGHLDRRADVLHLTANGLGGSVPITFRRVLDAEVPDLPDAPEAPPRRAEGTGYVEHAPEALGDGWATAMPSDEGLDPEMIARMVQAIVDEEMTFTHSVLVARHGRLVVEEYFYGFDRETWHDMRSASKTVASTLVGLAVRNGHIDGAESLALSCLPYRHYDNWDPRKATITLRHLMTMSSGLDANDSDPSSVASERAYQGQRHRSDWIKLALDAPMIADPGAQPLYGGANPLILGGVLAASVHEPVEWFAQQSLFGPLGIVDYMWFLDPSGGLYMGGGMYMGPRDMAKVGQLYLNGGMWQETRVLPEEWVKESWSRYGRLAPLERNGHEYGYLWWHHHYDIGGKTIETVEARGNGGQYISVAPALELVAVITSGNFRNGRTRQPEEILRRFILSAVR